MLGFFAAVCAELFSHVSVFEQFKRAAGPIFLVGAIIAVASIVPIVRGTNVLDDGQGKEGIPGKDGIRPGFNLTNELINGRAAMVVRSCLLHHDLHCHLRGNPQCWRLGGAHLRLHIIMPPACPAHATDAFGMAIAYLDPVSACAMS